MSRVAVIGAGPSGLATAKALLEQGFEPTVFDAASSIGGLWRAKDGFVWEDMRTNLSKWTCAFSDFPWPDEEDDFPLASSVERYLGNYAGHFGLAGLIELNTRVLSVQPHGRGWSLRTSDSDSEREFLGVAIASGVFSKPGIAPIPGTEHFKGQTFHSAQYRCNLIRTDTHVAIIGASLSGIEIAAHLADHGVQVTLLFSKPVWILPRFVASTSGRADIPLDLVLYHRAAGANDGAENLKQRNQRVAAYFQSAFGNPGDVNESLRTPVDGSPPFVVISDRFLDHVRDGRISPIRERLKSIDSAGVVTDSGRHIAVDTIGFCTGYEIDLGFLPANVHNCIEYDASDKFISYLADRTVFHPEIKNLHFVGTYRGPYFGVIELQARWAALMLAGQSLPSPEKSNTYLSRERSLRTQMPHQQFPHGDYVAFADSIASEIGVIPGPSGDASIDLAVKDGPVTPAQFRLSGPNASPAIAIPAIASAWKRINE